MLSLPTATPAATIDASLAPADVVAKAFFAMADERFVNDEYVARGVEASYNLDITKEIVTGLPSIAFRQDLEPTTARFLPAVARSGRDFYQVEYQYAATIGSDKAKITETIVVDPSTFCAVEFTRRAYDITKGFTLENKSHLRHIPRLTLTGSWSGSVSLAQLTPTTITILVSADGRFEGSVAVRVGIPVGAKLSGLAFYTNDQSENTNGTATKSGTSHELGGKYSEWDVQGLPKIFNLFPTYVKAGEYSWVVGLYDAATGLPLVDQEGAKLVRNTAVEVTP